MRYVILIFLLTIITFFFFHNEAYAFTYEVSNEIILPWGSGVGNVYTDAFEFDDAIYAVGGIPIYPVAWDTQGCSVYIVEVDFAETWVPNLIEINIETAEISEHQLDQDYWPHNMNIIGSANEAFIVDNGKRFTCYDHQINKVSNFLLL